MTLTASTGSSRSRSVFYGFGAYVGQVTGPTSCKWWAEDPNTLKPPFDPATAVEVNLNYNPRSYLQKKIALAAIQVDNPPVYGGLTKIGPTWPNGLYVNSCWLESGFYNRLANRPPRLASYDECREYELTTVIYWEGPLANRRFWGHYVEIEDERAGTNYALVSIWPQGKSLAPNQGPVRSVWMDLSNQHPIEAGFTEVGVGAHPKQGALFLDQSTVTSLSLTYTKRPPLSGLEAFPGTEE
jgi:hypothetical protein